MSATSPATAASAVAIPAAVSTASTSCSMPSPVRVVPTSPSSIASLAVPASTSTSAPAVVHPPQEVPETAAASVVDEVCIYSLVARLLNFHERRHPSASTATLTSGCLIARKASLPNQT